MRQLLILSLVLLAGCGTSREFKSHYSGYHVGDQFEVRQRLAIISYDYLIIPLVNPGVQLVPGSAIPTNGLAQEFKLVGYLDPGDVVRIVRFKIDGGWIPCHGVQFMANPVCEVVQGDRKGKRIGVSLISAQDRAKDSRYREGKMVYLEPDASMLQSHP
jgi:hypothetical protein